ncbi:MAG: hypothetical protein HY689_12080 [Chloroflexi bacterium]|nr:hypothetical protein [Chloroflexota bacterium]
MPNQARSEALDTVRAFLRLFWREGDVREVRIPKHNRFNHTAAGYFDDPEKLAAAAVRWDGRANIYLTLNFVNRALLARAYNRIDDRAEHTTADVDVEGRRLFFLDVDPVRAAGISSTDEETSAARVVLDEAVDHLRDLGWPEPIIAMSGNGWYALFSLDLPNTPEVTALISQLLKTLAGRFDTKAAHIDTTVSNPSRIVGLVGTLKVKGDSTDDRPHRRSHVVSVPDEIIPVTEQQLREAADVLQSQRRAYPEPEPGIKRPQTQRTGGIGHLVDLLNAAGLEYKEQPPDAAGITWYHVRRCPWHADGPEFECGVGQKLPDGPFAAHCFHNRGAGTGWQEWKEALGLGRGTRRRNARKGAPAEDGSAGGALPPVGAVYEDDNNEEVGITRRLADAITAEDHFALDAGQRLYVYRAGVYRRDGEAHVARRVKALCNEWGISKAWSTYRVKEVAAYIATDAPLLFQRPPGDRINVLNGILRLADLRLEPHTPEFLSPVQIPISYDPKARCPEWERQVRETVPEDAHQVVWEVLAWLLVADLAIKKAILLIGDGDNGKSVLLRAITAFVGKENVSNVTLHKLEADRFAAARLVGKLANICADLPTEHLSGTSVFKMITGGDPIQAEYKFKESFDLDAYCKLLFSANHPPRSADATSAFFERWVVIPFDAVFKGSTAIPSQVLDARLTAPSELSGALNRALAVLPGLREKGRFTEGASMRAAWLDFRGVTDPLAVWLDRSTVAGAEARVVKDDLLRAFNADCTREGRPPMMTKTFGKALRNLRPDVQEGRRMVGGEYVWCWLGIGLKAPGGDDGGARFRHGDVSHVNHVKYSPYLNEFGGEEESTEDQVAIDKVREMLDMVDMVDTRPAEAEGTAPSVREWEA